VTWKANGKIKEGNGISGLIFSPYPPRGRITLSEPLVTCHLINRILTT
jgi:hypothetical protein